MSPKSETLVVPQERGSSAQIISEWRSYLCLMVPAWVLLWLVLPLPFNLEERLVSFLQPRTARWSSQVLDLLGVSHHVTGQMVVAPGQRFFVADAWSGIHSFLTVLAFSLFFVFWMRRQPLHGILLVFLSLLWALAENVVRIVGVAYPYAKWQIDVLTGWRYEVLGWSLFALTLLFILSTDRLLEFLLAPIAWLLGGRAGPGSVLSPASLENPRLLGKPTRSCRRVDPVLVEWRRARQLVNLLQGLPALLVGIGALVLAYSLWLTGAGSVVAEYKRAASQSTSVRDYHAAKVCWEKLAQLEPNNPGHLFSLALVSLELGESDRALALMTLLAAPDKQGYAPAHLWQAERLLSGSPRPAEQRDCEHHLLRAIQALPEDVRAHHRLSQLYLATGRANLAEPHLLKILGTHPDAHFPLATLYATQGRMDEVRFQLKAAVRTFSKKVQTDPDDHSSRFSWSQATLMLGDLRGAAAILEKGLSLVKDPKPYHQRLAQVYAVGALRATAPAGRVAGAGLPVNKSRGPDEHALLGERMALIEQG